MTGYIPFSARVRASDFDFVEGALGALLRGCHAPKERRGNHRAHQNVRTESKLLAWRFPCARPSENQLQSQLNRAASARSENRIAGSYVRRRATAAETCAQHRWIIHAKAVLPAEWICESRMIEDVEEFGAELRGETLAEFPILRHGEIPVAEAGIAERIASHRSEGADGRRDHRGILCRIAAE